MPNVVTRRAPLRLQADAYADPSATCSVTIGVKNRERVFTNAAVAQLVVDVLGEHVRATGVRLWAYCVMPDHVHLVLSPSSDCDIVSFVGAFKSLVARRSWTLGLRGSFWQPRFWDHFVHNGAQAERQIRYVVDNPVRAGIVSSSDQYPYCGYGDPNGKMRGTSPRPTA